MFDRPILKLLLLPLLLLLLLLLPKPGEPTLAKPNEASNQEQPISSSSSSQAVEIHHNRQAEGSSEKYENEERQDKEANQTQATDTSSSQGGPAEQVPPYMQHMTIILVCLHVSVFITGLVGNSLVCLSVLRNKSLQTVTNYYIVNLAVADFLVILICLPPTVYWDLTLTWNFGLILCKLVLYLQSISVSVSVLTLTCISIDRWYAICRPLEFSSTKYRAKITIGFIWLLSMLIGSPDAIFLTTKQLYEEDDYVYTDCTYIWPESNTKIYQLCIVTLLFVGPFVLMSISYSHIVNVLWRNEIAQSGIQFEGEIGACASDYGNMPSTSAAAPMLASNQDQDQHQHQHQHQDHWQKQKEKQKQNRKRTDKKWTKKWGGNDKNDDMDSETNNKHQSMTANKIRSLAAGSAPTVVVVAADASGSSDCSWTEQRPTIVDGWHPIDLKHAHKHQQQQQQQQHQIDLKLTHKEQQRQTGREASEIGPIDGRCSANGDPDPDTDTDTDADQPDLKQESQAGNELGNCLVFVSEFETDSEVALGRHQQRRPSKARDWKEVEKVIPMIQGASDTKSSCVQLSGPNQAKPSVTTTMTAAARGERSVEKENDAAARDATKGGLLIGGPECAASTSATTMDAHEAGTTAGPLKASGSDERMKRCRYRCCYCCGFLPGGRIGLVWSAHGDHLGQSFSCSKLLAKPLTLGQPAAPAKSTAKSTAAATATASASTPSSAIIKDDGTTSKKYRRNLANYAAKRDKYRPSSSQASVKTKGAVKSLPPAPSSVSQNEFDANGSLAKQSCDHSQNNLHLPNQQQQQQANYLSSSSSNNARFYKLIESRKKAAKMLIVIVIMFGLCYLPIHFLNTLRYTIGLPQNDITTIASLVSHWLCYFNSAINPLIYNLMSGKFRKEFANLFFCRCFRRNGQN